MIDSLVIFQDNENSIFDMKTNHQRLWCPATVDLIDRDWSKA